MNSKSAQDEVRTAGRGGLALSFAKIYFMVLGLAQQIVLSWLLQDSYGALRGALSPASIAYNAAVTASVFGMSRAVSRADVRDRPHVIRVGLSIQTGVGLALGTAFFLGATPLGWLLNSAYLVPMFRVMSVVVAAYTIYAAFIGILNGQQRFVSQALLDVVAATLRTVALVAGAYYFASSGALSAVIGSVWGFAIMAVAMTLVAAVLVGLPKRNPRPAMAEATVRPYGVKQHLQFVLPVMGAQTLMNLLLQADTNTLRAFATRAAERAGHEAAEADLYVGAYNAGQLFAFLPYQLLTALAFVLFPLLAQARAEGNQAAVARVVNGGTRVAIVVIGLVVSVTAALPELLLRVVFPPQFATIGAESMRYLALGLGGLALYGVFSAVLNSLERQWVVLCLTAGGLVLVFAGNWAFVAGVPFGEQLLTRTALATSVAVVVVAVAAGFVVQRETGGGIVGKSALRVAVAVAVCVGAGNLMPSMGKVATLGAAGGLALSYVGLLVLLREVTRVDLRAVQSVVRRRRPS